MNNNSLPAVLMAIIVVWDGSSACVIHQAHADSSVPEPRGQLRVEVLQSPLPQHAGFVRLQAASMRWELDGKIVWKLPLPETWQKITALENRFAADPALAEGTVQSIFHPLNRLDAIVLSDEHGLCVLDRADGHIRAQWTQKPAPPNPFFDQGSVIISEKSRRCTEPVRGSRFLVECAGKLFLFTGSALAVFDGSTYKLLGSGEFGHVRMHMARVQADATIAGAKIQLDGFILE
jgi:hypothetical protein